MYTTTLLWNLPIIVPAIIGRRLVRKGWSRHREVCTLVTWACGLFVYVGLAQASFWSGTLPLRDLYRWERPARWCFEGATGIAIWVLIRASLLALDFRPQKTERLSELQLRSLLPVVRTYRSASGFRAIVVGEDRISVGAISENALEQDSFLESDSHFTQGTEFAVSPAKSSPVAPGVGLLGQERPEAIPAAARSSAMRPAEVPRVVVEQIGVIGPSRHWLRLRLITTLVTETFWVPVNDYPHLRDAIRLVLPDRLEERKIPRRSRWERMLLVATIVFVLILLGSDRIIPIFRDMPASLESYSLSFGLAGALALMAAWLLILAPVYGPLFVLISYLITGWNGFRSPLRPPSPRVRVRRGPASDQPPFRSDSLGWATKIGSFVYTMLLLGTDGFGLPSSALNPAVWSLLLAPGVATMYEGHRLTRRVFSPGSHPDSRPPFLFLRAFDDDDRTTIQPRTWLARIQGIAPDFGKKGKGRSFFQYGAGFYPVRWFRWFLGCPVETVEETLALGVSRVGPLVAIGQPGERYVTSGADRMYVSDDRWQEVVQSYVGRSFGVILQPSLTDGVLWEIEQTCRSVPLHRVLISLVNFQERPNAYEDLWLLLREKYQMSLPLTAPHFDRPCFAYFTASGGARLQPVVYHPTRWWPLLGNAINITATLEPYLRGLSGDPEPAPTAATRFGFFEIVLSLAITAALTWLVAVGLPYIVWVLYMNLK
jgi:hypothetical protein